MNSLEYDCGNHVAALDNKLKNCAAMWGRLLTCAAVGNRRTCCVHLAGRPIDNRPQVNNLPHISSTERLSSDTEGLCRNAGVLQKRSDIVGDVFAGPVQR